MKPGPKAPSSIAGVPVQEVFGPYFSRDLQGKGRAVRVAFESSSDDSDDDERGRRTNRQAATASRSVTTRTTVTGSKTQHHVTATTTRSVIEEELRDNLHFMELQLVNMRDENAKLKQSYHQKLEELASTLKVCFLLRT